jgi:putative heme-binding domain-containing protein
MNARCRLMLLLFCASLTATPLAAEEIAEWEFKGSEAGWTPNDQAQLSVADGVLQVRSSGVDPFFSTAVQGRAGQHRIVISAKFKGNANIQVFWTTEASPQTSEDKSVQGELRGSDKEFRSLKLYFSTDSPVTSLRIDPLSRAGRMEIDAIILSDDAPPLPEATPVSDLKIAAGFSAELLYSVPSETMGSWVCMTSDPKGRLIVSDQYGKLYRVTPPAQGSDQQIMIEPIAVDVGMAQGLLCAFDSLYVMTNSGDKPRVGLHRVRDTNGDDQYDSSEHLRVLEGGNEHGPHAIILSPDGKSLIVACGNHTPPTQFSRSRVPTIWNEDQLLPRMWDAGGHAVGILAPGGWIAKVSPDGKDWELLSMGFRNQYDIALNPLGELFTYDADMEWDVGSPWYRPTRVNHVTGGSEFGWRSGTGKWPEYYPDSLGSVVDIGPGSPTGITFGTGAKFPAKYQHSLFISDWSYGVIYAVQMTPEGASWKGTAERFISAAPLPVTDVIVNPHDQAMYFTIGGRRTQSGLYRVTYTGSESTATAAFDQEPGRADRELRKSLEAFHQTHAEAVAKAWPYLGHSDRTIRFAARTAIEHQPAAAWAEKALAEKSSPDARITALLALARCGDPAHQNALLASLGELKAAELSESQQLDALRVLGLCFIRMGKPDEDTARQVAAALSPLYPARSPRLNRELCRVLVYLNAPDVAAKTLDLLAKAPSQEEQIHYAYCLRALDGPWTIEQRKAYFEWFVKSVTLRGGNSFSGFIKNIRQEAIDRLSEGEKTALREVLEAQPTGGQPLVEAAARAVVKEWTVNDFLADVEAGLRGRNFDNGRRMFQVTACFKCHRFAGDGGIVGPELTAVSRRYNARTLLESIIEPSKVISDQYEASMFVLDSGRTVAGRVVNLNSDRIMVCENMLEPGNLTTVARDEIEDTLVSKVSMMPAGLINTLTRDEVLDLIAFLQSGGDPDSPVFAQPRKSAQNTPAQPGKTQAMKPQFSDAGHVLDPLDHVKQQVETKSAVLLDVREADEWAAGHLADARLLPLSQLKSATPASIAESLPKDKPVYVHCKSGGRVLMFAEALQNQGVDLRPLRAGYENLLQAGFKKAD